MRLGAQPRRKDGAGGAAANNDHVKGSSAASDIRLARRSGARTTDPHHRPGRQYITPGYRHDLTPKQVSGVDQIGLDPTLPGGRNRDDTAVGRDHTQRGLDHYASNSVEHDVGVCAASMSVMMSVWSVGERSGLADRGWLQAWSFLFAVQSILERRSPA